MTNGIIVEEILNDILKEYEEETKQQYTNKTKTKEYRKRHDFDSTTPKNIEINNQSHVADYMLQQDCWHYDYMEA